MPCGVREGADAWPGSWAGCRLCLVGRVGEELLQRHGRLARHRGDGVDQLLVHVRLEARAGQGRILSWATAGSRGCPSCLVEGFWQGCAEDADDLMQLVEVVVPGEEHPAEQQLCARAHSGGVRPHAASSLGRGAHPQRCSRRTTDRLPLCSEIPAAESPARGTTA